MSQELTEIPNITEVTAMEMNIAVAQCMDTSERWQLKKAVAMVIAGYQYRLKTGVSGMAERDAIRHRIQYLQAVRESIDAILDIRVDDIPF